MTGIHLFAIVGPEGDEGIFSIPLVGAPGTRLLCMATDRSEKLHLMSGAIRLLLERAPADQRLPVQHLLFPPPLPRETLLVRVTLRDAVVYRRSGIVPSSAILALADALDGIDGEQLQQDYALWEAQARERNPKGWGA